ncbi:MAG TPA: hypothetical protein VGH99_10555 [Pseudonocardia sp.]
MPRFVVVSETLRRSGDARGERLIDQAARREHEEGWEFTVALTDLPVHKDGRPLVAELSQHAWAAVLAVPALNMLRPADEAREIVATLLEERVSGREPDPDDRPLRRPDERSRALRTVRPDDDVDVRLTRSAGSSQPLAGMVRVNCPWRLVLGLRARGGGRHGSLRAGLQPGLAGQRGDEHPATVGRHHGVVGISDGLADPEPRAAAARPVR